MFYNPETGGHWKDLWLALKTACRKAGLNNEVAWHTFRHTFASRLNGNGADLVRRLGGAGSDKIVTMADPAKKSA